MVDLDIESDATTEATMTRLDTTRPTTGVHFGRGALRRWPTLLGLVTALAAGWEVVGGDVVASVDRSAAIAVPVLVYLTAATLGRPAVAWPLTIAATAAVFGLSSVGVDPVLGLVSVTAVVLVVGLLLRDRHHIPRPSTAQVLGAVGFGAAAAAALSLTPTLGAFVVGAGLIGHAVWDVAHHRRNAVVPRSVAEFCAVLDTAVGLAVLGVATASLA